MADYIDRELALKCLEYCPIQTNNEDSIPAVLEMVRKKIVRLPYKRISVADVVEVKHGEWVHEHISDGYAWVMCSECGTTVHKILINNRMNYCPNCGAKMDLEG